MTATAEGDKYVIKLDDGRFVKCKPHRVSATRPALAGAGGGQSANGGLGENSDGGRLVM